MIKAAILSRIHLRVLGVSLASLLMLCLSSLSSYAQDNGIIQFSSETGNPVKVTVFQEIPGFRSALHSLDQDTGLIHKGTEWTPMVDADVWVFYLKDETDASLLPSFILELLEQNYDGSPAYALSATISINGRPEEKMMFFVFLEKFGSEQLAAIGCDTAALVYAQLRGSEIADVQVAQNGCFLE